MPLIRVAGLLILLVGLVLIGVSGDNHRVANGRHIIYGASLIMLGAIAAVFAGQFEALIAWARP
jgi:hypothetical protein